VGAPSSAPWTTPSSGRCHRHHPAQDATDGGRLPSGRRLGPRPTVHGPGGVHPAAEVEPRVFVSSDAASMRLAVRFVVPIRTGRAVRDTLTRGVSDRLEAAGIEVVGTQVIQQAREPWQPIGDDRPRAGAEDDQGSRAGSDPARWDLATGRQAERRLYLIRWGWSAAAPSSFRRNAS
jgi:hypothetical protein